MNEKLNASRLARRSHRYGVYYQMSTDGQSVGTLAS